MAEKARDIKRRIKSVESTKKITNAMQLIAASRIGKAQARTERARPYANAITEMIEMLADESRSSPLLAEREIESAGILVITGDRGLSGAYNANVLREAQRAVARQRQAGREAKVISIGRKGGSYFRFRGTELAGTFSGMSDKPSYDDAQEIAKGIIDDYTEGRMDVVLLVYTEFLSASVQRARVAQILPVPRPEEEEEDEGPKAVFEFEPEPDALLEALLPKYVEVKVFGALLESSTSEHASRMRAMKSATDKAEELIKVFQLKANNARQAEITNEIADIVGGTEALSSAQR
ncbi:MAG TPA: F0F1 ATP synthase subunit gamma [Actinomycetota bacterium]|nr:F0F1 ATP synthase subunit gamma [Actinomycetota bacterium]